MVIAKAGWSREARLDSCQIITCWVMEGKTGCSSLWQWLSPAGMGGTWLLVVMHTNNHLSGLLLG